MKLMNRNKRTVYYCLYQGEEALTAPDGSLSGEYRIRYSEPVELAACVSLPGGKTECGPFGNLQSYERVVLTDNIGCPIDEQTVFFLDKEPEFNSDGLPLYDYAVRCVAKSLNFLSVKVAKGEVE